MHRLIVLELSYEMKNVIANTNVKDSAGHKRINALNLNVRLRDTYIHLF